MPSLSSRLEPYAKRLEAYASVQAWTRGALRRSLHHATSALITALTTNGVQAMFPETFPHIGLTPAQCAAMFATSLFISSLFAINKATARPTTPPFGGNPPA